MLSNSLDFGCQQLEKATWKLDFVFIYNFRLIQFFSPYDLSRTRFEYRCGVVEADEYLTWELCRSIRSFQRIFWNLTCYVELAASMSM